MLYLLDHKEDITPVTSEMSQFGVDESVLRQMVSFAIHKGNLKWRLPSIPTIRFYSDLHKFLTKKHLSYEQTGHVFKTIDPWLNSSTKTYTNACIKTKRLTTKCRNLDQVM